MLQNPLVSISGAAVTPLFGTTAAANPIFCPQCKFSDWEEVYPGSLKIATCKHPEKPFRYLEANEPVCGKVEARPPIATILGTGHPFLTKLTRASIHEKVSNAAPTVDKLIAIALSIAFAVDTIMRIVAAIHPH